MGDNLPLIPEKVSVCADVRPVLREVFRELDCLPPLALTGQRPTTDGDGDNSLPKVEPWIPKFNSECRELWQREGELKQQHALRISREPLPNIYKLHPTKEKLTKTPSWKNEKGILERKDLMPSILQNAGRSDSLWVKNILNTSSGDLSSTELVGSKIRVPVRLETPREPSLQSLSFGEIVPPPPLLPPPAAPPPPLPEYILCVPPQLDFVNFTVGQLQTQCVRLVNVSKFECRLSVRPPRHPELDVELCGARPLAVSSGAATHLKVHFRPRNVRVLRDVLVVRVSTGRSLVVPICCYMQPPLLDILVPAVASSILVCEGAGSGSSLVERQDPVLGGSVLELGARLLGDVHDVRVLFHCAARHAAFFMLTEDAWLDCCLDALSSDGSLVSPPFVVSPAWWRGGGAVTARVRCRAHTAGLHAAALRLLTTTAVVRPLHLLADALYYRPDHVTIEAHEKDYDICCDDDPGCEYYVHLGTAFPHQALAATVRLVNHSAVVYSYYWTSRPWGVCSCWEEQKASQGSLGPEDDPDQLCVGAKEARDMEREGRAPRPVPLVVVEPALGSVAPRSSCEVRVCAPDVGDTLGTTRAVLMLILKDIPKESFPNDFDPVIVKTRVVETEPIPGIKESVGEVCSVMCAQLEVWWEVAPVRFVLDPPVLTLNHSRRVQSIEVQVLATQLLGSSPVRGWWRVPLGWPPPAPAAMCTTQSCAVSVTCPLPALPNEYPETDVITLQSTGGDWSTSCSITRCTLSRHPALRPARVWRGVVPPAAAVRAELTVHNDTYQHICWWASAYRWCGESVASGACVGRAPCDACRERRCTCDILRPTRGALDHGAAETIYYSVNAPERDGCVATLAQTCRTAADVCRMPGGAGLEARAALLCYRVLAPRIVLRVLPCLGDKTRNCAGCDLDEGAKPSGRGTATLRPRAALVMNRLVCARLRVTNLTPIPTAVVWDPPLEDDVLNMVFFPNELQVGGYGEVEFQVVIEPRRVCGRRVFVRRARALHAYNPIYLLVDAAVKGLEIVFEVPIGDGLQTDSTLIMRRTQREEFPWDAGGVKASSCSPEELFEEEDRKRAVRAENICSCHYELQYIPPVKRPRPPDVTPSIEIVSTPPVLTRVCACFPSSPVTLPAHAHAPALQFTDLPLMTVRSRSVRLRNESDLEARWRVTLRTHNQQHTRTFAAAGSQDTGSTGAGSGLALSCWPCSGVLRARATTDVRVQACADCWGLYHDQLLIEVERVEPLVVDVWAEARGAPLLFALKLGREHDDAPLLLWLSASDPVRTLRIKNSSRAPLLVHAYMLTEHETEQDTLPFRVYLRTVDVAPRVCACLDARPSDSCLGEESAESNTSYEEEMDTGFELYLAPDFGRQENEFFTVSPESTTVSPDTWSSWQVCLRAPPTAPAPPAALLLRALPLTNQGCGWYRPSPPPVVVHLRQTRQTTRLKASTRELRVTLCALDLPYQDVLRVRKHFRIQNIGCGPLEVCARCAAPWCLVRGEGQARCGAGCRCGGGGEGEGEGAEREGGAALHLLPRSSMEMCVEARVETAQAWPAPAEDAAPPSYQQWRRTITKLRFYDAYNVLLTIPLHLELEYPVIRLEPAVLDFGFVTDGDTRKSYFTVSHSSRTATVDMVSAWVGAPQFRVWPRDFSLQPGGRERLYIQYTAKWCGAPTEGFARVAAACGAGVGVGAGCEGGGGGGWCRAAARARAAAARDCDRRMYAHDHTDDTHLLPPEVHTPATHHL